MKKTLLATALLGLISSSAMAVPVYEQNSMKVDVYGRLGIYLGKNEQVNTDIFDDESRLGVSVKYGITNEVDALGGVELRFADSNRRFTDPTTYDAFVGLRHKGIGTVTIGRQATTADDLALSKFAYQNENITLSPKHGDRTIKVRTTDYDLGAIGTIALGADYTFMGTNDKTVDIKSRSTGGGLFYTNQLGDVGFKLNGGYTHVQEGDDTTRGIKNIAKSWLVGTQLSYDLFDLGIDYAQRDTKSKQVTTGLESPTLSSKATQVALRYRATDKANVFATYQYGKDSYLQDKATKNQYTIGADYKLYENVLTYAQVSTVKIKHGMDKTTDVGGALGLRVSF